MNENREYRHLLICDSNSAILFLNARSSSASFLPCAFSVSVSLSEAATWKDKGLHKRSHNGLQGGLPRMMQSGYILISCVKRMS